MNEATASPAGLPRRRVLRILAVGGAAAAAWVLGMRRGPGRPVTRTRVLMGTTVTVTVYGDDERESEAAVEATFARMAGLERCLSRYRDDSDVGRLNATGRVDDACDALLDLIALAARISTLGEGAFDVTVGPLVDLYQRTYDERRVLPEPAAVEAARALVDYRRISVQGRLVRFERPGMRMTLDGIGKGYIVDRGVEVLRGRGYANVLVEAGGDLLASGLKRGDVPWTIGIQAPRPGMRLVSFEATNRAAATSGDYMQPFAPDASQHHILDPRTGRSSPELASSTIVAPDAATADGLATLTMVLGARRSLELLESLDACEGYFVAKDGTVTRSPGLDVS